MKGLSLKQLSVVLLALVLELILVRVAGAQCTPVSASLIGSADDQLNVWINGSGPYGPINYITAGTGAIPPISIPPGVFNTSGPNIIAALNQDMTASVVESSWVIDVTCSSGQHAYFTSSDAGLKMYVSPCSAGSSPAPPNDGSGNPWYSPSYGSTATYFTGTPTVITGQAAPIWLQPMYNPQTGAVQPWIGMNTTAVDTYGGCTGLYYRESVALNPQPYVPPNFTVTKSASANTIAQSSGSTLAYKIVVCNSGAPVNTPVTVYDTLQYNTGEYYTGPYYTFSPPTQMFTQLGAGQFGSPAYFVFPTGFVGNGGCVTISYNMNMGYTINPPVCVLVNQASVTYAGVGKTGSAAVTVSGCASTPTDTNTSTPTKTPTPSPTATNTPTKTWTSTFTNTFTNTYTPTITMTFTNTVTKTFTNTFTNTFTPSPTPTFTNTFTKTFTATYTNTPTSTPTFTNTFTNTFTATSANTATFTNTFTKTFTSTPSNTFTNTPTATYTNTFLNTPTFTNTLTKTSTSTFTNTPTPSPTVTNTFTSTPTATYTNTFMNSPTFTNTFTVTATNTVTNTPTASPTATNTFTNTPTFTYTNTFMNSPTFTNTFTNTNTETVTNTPTFSPTATNSFTDTPTLTYTNTFVNTPTWTNTLTDTPTLTYTNTLVNTATFTDTFTNTNTFTPTLTDTSTPTSTPTLTYTNTFINTATFTNTTTNTPTFTATSTPTVYVGIGKTVSENPANAGDVLNYTIAVTVTGPGLTNAIITDTLPAHMTFQAFGGSVAGTVSSFNAGLNQLQWVLPSPLAAGVYDLTYQTKLDTFAPANVALVNFAQLTYSGSTQPLTASAPVTVIGNFSVKINIYNSAGEVVKTIPIQQFSAAINNITLSTTNTITTLSGPGSTIDILFNGYVIGVWDGTNNQGKPVANGAYQVQVDNVSSSGTVTSVSQKAIVSRNISNIEVDIFNEAGEVVRRLYNVVSNATSSSMTSVTLSTTVIKPTLSAPISMSGVLNSDVKIFVQDSASPVTLIWDGTNNVGNMVTPGQYQIAVHWTDGSGQTSDITRTIMVVPNYGVSGIAIARPNVLNPALGMTTTFDATGVANASSLKVKIYTTSGELIQSWTAASTQTVWNASGLASGIYLANVEMDNVTGGLVNRQFLKVLVTH